MPGTPIQTFNDFMNATGPTYLTSADQVINEAVKNTYAFSRLLKEKTSEETKERMGALKALRSQVREAANKCSEFMALNAALDVLSGAADFDYMTGADEELHEEDQD